jgi:hypothetical protein
VHAIRPTKGHGAQIRRAPARRSDGRSNNPGWDKVNAKASIFILPTPEYRPRFVARAVKSAHIIGINSIFEP